MKKTLVLLTGLLLLGGCTTTPTAMSHQHISPDGTHWAFQIAMHSGILNTPRQTVMIVYNKWSRKPIAIVEGQTKPIGEKLFDDILTLINTAGASAITGNYLLQAAKVDCPPGTLCGTLVQVQNTAGASAESAASNN